MQACITFKVMAQSLENFLKDLFQGEPSVRQNARQIYTPLNVDLVLNL